MKLISMTDFVFYLRNMTTAEHCLTYPKVFKPLLYKEHNQAVKDMLAHDAILWRLTGNYAKFLSQKLDAKMFLSEKETDKPFVITEVRNDSSELYRGYSFKINDTHKYLEYNEKTDRFYHGCHRIENLVDFEPTITEYYLNQIFR